MIPCRLDFPVQTNGDYAEEFETSLNGIPFDLSGYSIRAHVKISYDASDALIRLEPTNNAENEGICITNAVSGLWQIRLNKDTIRAAFDAVNPSAYIGQKISLPIDTVFSDTNGDEQPWTYGYVLMTKGITNG